MMNKLQTGVCKEYESKFKNYDTIAFSAKCGCGNNDCDATLSFEYDDGFASLTVYKTMWSHEKSIALADHDAAQSEFWKLEDKLEKGEIEKKEYYMYWILNILPAKFGILWNRIKQCCEILWTGMIEIEGEISISNPEHLKGIVMAMDEGIERLSEYDNEMALARDEIRKSRENDSI